ncbi:MAG: hypothetical protein V4561_10750 [Bacteroidota bacterium]
MSILSFSLRLCAIFILIFGVDISKVAAQDNGFMYIFSTQPGNPKVSYRGNIFELWSPPSDTIYVENTETGQREMKISVTDLYPIKMNDLPIPTAKDVESIALPERSLGEYFIDLALKNKELFNQLPDGQYRINPRHFVVSEEGKILYYKFDGIETIRQAAGTDGNAKNDKTKAEISKIIHEFISSDNIHFEAAEKDKKKTLSIVLYCANVGFTVKEHKMTVDL